MVWIEKKINDKKKNQKLFNIYVHKDKIVRQSRKEYKLKKPK